MKRLEYLTADKELKNKRYQKLHNTYEFDKIINNEKPALQFIKSNL